MANGSKQKYPQNVTDLDAAHPRFVEPLKGSELDKYQFENLYYCDTCKVYFDSTFEAVKFHFKEDIVRHPPFGPCFYCNKPVYFYKFKGDIKYFHNCN